MKTNLIKQIMKKAKTTNKSCLENLNIAQLTFILEDLERLTDEA
jgi:hypothetical protein